jgi:hypothetical protein
MKSHRHASILSTAQLAEQAFYIAFLSGFLVMAGSFLSQVVSIHAKEQPIGVARQIERPLNLGQAAS